jgi:hypothetical protein
MADDRRRERIPASKPRPPELPRLPCPQVEQAATQHPCVVSIQAWKRRPAHEGRTLPAGAKPTRENLLLLSRPQKQAALLKLILSDTILEEELDAMLQAAVSI